jgi:hypothetical protein
MKKTIVQNFTEFINESLIHRKNIWEISFPSKWKALQDLGFRDATTDRMKKMGNNVLLMNDMFPFYPSGIVYQETGYLRDKNARSGWITAGKNWEEAADYLIDKFSLLKSGVPPGVDPEIFTIFLNGSTSINKSVIKKIVIDPGKKKVRINGNFFIHSSNLPVLLDSGYNLEHVNSLFIADKDRENSYYRIDKGLKPLHLNLSECLKIMPDTCNNLVIRNVHFAEDCQDVSFFPLVKEGIRVTGVEGIVNCRFLHPDQNKLDNLALNLPLESLDGMVVMKCDLVTILKGDHWPYRVQIEFGRLKDKKWGIGGWLEVIKNGNAEESNLMSTLPFIDADYWWDQLTGDLKLDGQVLLDISYLWDEPGWEHEREKLMKKLDPKQIKTIKALQTKHVYLR